MSELAQNERVGTNKRVSSKMRISSKCMIKLKKSKMSGQTLSKQMGLHNLSECAIGHFHNKPVQLQFMI